MNELRNLDVENNIMRKRTFHYKGEEDGKQVEIFNLINATTELVVYLEDGVEVASIFNRKKFNGERDIYNLEIFGDLGKISEFLEDGLGKLEDKVKGINAKKGMDTISFNGRLYQEIRATKQNCPYPLSKVRTLEYIKHNDTKNEYSESFKMDKLTTLPFDAVKNNYKYVKSGNTYKKQFGDPIKEDGKIKKDENGNTEYIPYDFSWIIKKNYRILTTDEEIYEYLEGLEKTDEIVGFDTETTGLKVHKYKTDKLVGICMSYEEDAGVYFPLDHKTFDNVDMGAEKFLEILKPYCDTDSPKRKDLILHNGGFDWKVMRMYGWDLNVVHDTMILQSLQNIASNKHILSLKGVASDVLKLDTLDLGDIFYKLTKEEKQDGLMDFRYMSYDLARVYCGFDADAPRLLFKIIEEKWDSDLDYIYALEMNVLKVVASQEYEGMRVDLDIMKELEDEAMKRKKELIEEIYEIAGEKFKISSNDQKQYILYEKMGLPKISRFKTKSGYATDAAMMDYFSDMVDDNGNKKYPIIEKLQEYSKVSQRLNLFYQKIPLMEDKGHIFPNYKQLGTESGRLSSNSPNLQQTEPQARKSMLPTSEDYYFLICDYSQVEYRLSAGMHGEKKVVDFFKSNPEADYHKMAYSNMMGIPYNEVTSKQRKEGKVLNFAISYGLQAPSLAITLYGDDGHIFQQKALKQQAKYFDGVPNIRDHTKVVEEEAFKKGYVETLFKRKRDIEEFQFIHKYGDSLSNFSYEKERSSGNRKAGNTYIQGTAADIMKMAMVNCYNRFKREDLDVKIILNVHDELGFQVHKKHNMWYVIKVIRECMEIDLSRYNIPPLYVGANVGYSWFDGKVDELEAPVILMDRKGKEIEDMISKIMEDKGITYREAVDLIPNYEDPREVFREDLVKFSIQVVEEEIKDNNYKTVLEVMENDRAVGYMEDYYLPYVGYKLGDISKDELEKKKYILVDALFKSGLDTDKLWGVKDKLMNITKYTIPKVEESKESLKVDEKLKTIEDEIKDTVKIEGNLLYVKDKDFSKSLFNILQELTIPYEVKSMFKSNIKFYKLMYYDVEDGITHQYNGYFPSCYGKILKDLLYEHFTKGLVGNDVVTRILNEDYEEVSMKNIKEGAI